jgi:serine O-acetyltransferase
VSNLTMQEKLNFGYMGSALVRSIADYNRYKGRQGIRSHILRKLCKLRHLFWSVMTASEVDINTSIGEGLLLPHPQGVIVHAKAVIGDNCMFMQQVTVGQLDDNEVPVIGSGVYIGAGAKVLGMVRIGDGARIGANAVVLCDVPANWTAVGVPARLIPQNLVRYNRV